MDETFFKKLLTVKLFSIGMNVYSATTQSIQIKII